MGGIVPMSKRKAKHRYSESENLAVWALLSPDEQKEYNELALGWGLSGATANLSGMRAIENLGYERLREESQ